MKYSLFHSVLAVCVTVLIMFVGYMWQRSDEIKVDLVVECIYANQNVEDPVEDCVKNIVPRMLKLSSTPQEVQNENGL